MVILTALLSASKASKSDMISAVAPPSFCPKDQNQTNEKIQNLNETLDLEIKIYLTKPVEIFKVCLVKSIPHYFNIHIIQVL